MEADVNTFLFGFIAGIAVMLAAAVATVILLLVAIFHEPSPTLQPESESHAPNLSI